MNKFKPGMHCKISEGSGIDSGKVITVIPANYIPLLASGIPDIPGYYRPADFQREIPIQFSDGRIGLMYSNRLEII